MAPTQNEAVETYRDIIGYEGYYQVSDLGNVRSLARKVLGSAVFPIKIVRERQLIFNTADDYYRVGLSREGKVKLLQVHRLVAIAFIPNPAGLAQVNHKNGLKHDNRVQNLEWMSIQQNIAHAVQTGLSARGERKASAKLTAEQVLEIRRLAPTHTRLALSKLFGVSKSAIALIVRRRNWTHI